MRLSFRRSQDRQALVSGERAALDSSSSRALLGADREDLEKVAAASPTDTEPAEPDRQIFDVQSRSIQVHSVPHAETYVIVDERLHLGRAALRRFHRSPLGEPPQILASTSRQSWPLLRTAKHRMADPGPVHLTADTFSRQPPLRSGLALNAIVATVVMATFIVGPFYSTVGLGLGVAELGEVMFVGPASGATDHPRPNHAAHRASVLVPRIVSASM